MAVLSGGNGLAQLLGILAVPLLINLYSPDDFRLLAVYVAVVTILMPIATMRLDAAIPIPENDDEAISLMVLSAITTLLLVILLSVAIVFFGPTIAKTIGYSDLVPHLWLFPFGVGLIGAYSNLQYMAVRNKSFNLLARTKLLQASLGVSMQLGMGWNGLGVVGLLFGHALFSGAGVLSLGKASLKKSLSKASAKYLSITALIKTLRKYQRFPRYSVLEVLCNNLGIQLPILIIATYSMGPEAGLLFLAMRLVGAPMTIIGSSFSSVYFSEAPQYKRDGNLVVETVSLVKRISRFVVLPFLAAAPFAVKLLPKFIDSEWDSLGPIILMMLPWYSFRLIASPISMVMHVQMRQKLMLGLTFFGLILRVVPIIVALMLFTDFLTLSYAMFSAVFYLIIVIVSLRVSGATPTQIVSLMLVETSLWILVSGSAFFLAGELING